MKLSSLRKSFFLLPCLSLVFVGSTFAEGEDSASAPDREQSLNASPSGEYLLQDFGPVSTPEEAEAALQKATEVILSKGGGFLVIPPGVAANWIPRNHAPTSTKENTPKVTVVDRREGTEKILLPSNGSLIGGVWAGQLLKRDVFQPVDMEFGVHSTQVLETNIAGGTTSYAQPTVEAVKAGKDARIYVTTIRGLAVGNHFYISGEPLNWGGERDNGPIKALGWDKEKRLPYIIMDLEKDHPKGALVYNKHVVNSMSIVDHSQSDNQSMGLIVKRNNYGQGDSFVISASSVSQGNIMSAAGDEGGLTYASDISNDLNPFASSVESVDWSKGELVYEPGPVRNHTLGTSRPIINMNPEKHLTKGVAWIVPPGHKDPWKAQEHPELEAELPIYVGGAIIGSQDTGWTQDVVGRFFAVDEPEEYLDPANDPSAGYTVAPSMRVYRWYLIQRLEDLPDGRKRLYVERTRWFSGNAWVPILYRWSSYSTKGEIQPLHYIIAPGAYVADVSKSWTPSEHSGGVAHPSDLRTLILAESSDAGTAFDFKKGDPIVQAIGADPWNVTGMRVRHFNYVPSTIEDASYDAANLGRVMVNSGFQLEGGDGNLKEDQEKSKDGRPRYGTGIHIKATTHVGLSFYGDVGEAAIQFHQRNHRAQPIFWATKYGRLSNALIVDPDKAEFEFHGGAAAHFPGVMIRNKGGISGSDKPASNLRDMGVAIPEASTEFLVHFPNEEVDANYALYVQPSWFTNAVTTKKTKEGFTVQFEKPASKGASIDWILVR